MWWPTLFEIIAPLPDALHLFYITYVDRALYEFIFLGIIPGTEARISFDAVVYAGLLMILTLLVRTRRAHRKHTPSSVTDQTTSTASLELVSA